MALSPSGGKTSSNRKSWVTAVVLLICTQGVLFLLSLHPDYVVASNDGPLGGMVSELNRMPQILTGIWADLNWLGTPGLSPAPTVSTLFRLITTPVGWAKFYAPFSMFFVGLAAWVCFRSFRLSTLACILGALAVTLNSDFFSSACWGVCSHPITIGAGFFALAAMSDSATPPTWSRIILAGMSVGVAIMEGYDIGAIFSLFIAAYIFFLSLLGKGMVIGKVTKGVSRTAVVAVIAALLAAHSLSSLLATQIKGVAGMEQDTETKAQRWDFATQWSFPKGEVFRILIPGLFGYRMDTPKSMEAFSEWFEGGAYWGKAGETPGWLEHHNDPEWNRTHPGAYPRFSGGGEYAGVLVVLVAVWGIAQSFRKKDSALNPTQIKCVWFWTGAAIVSLLLAFGRFAPFYQFFYMLPYFSTIRNPAKFMHTFHWSLLILFAYGMNGLSRRYLDSTVSSAATDLSSHFRIWWVKASSFDKKWTTRSVLCVAASLLGWLVYAASRPSLEKRLQDVGFGDPALARQISGFSLTEVGLFTLFLAVAVGLFALVLSGRFAGSRARAAGILLGAFLVVDLARANLPWIIYWNYPDKYATNPIIDRLRQKPYEGRVTIFPLDRFLRFDRLPPEARPLIEVYQQLSGIYRIEWMQQQFQYYNIQCLDIVQMPRAPVDYVAFETALSVSPLRRWELTNTRYLFGPAALFESLNQQFDPVEKRFRVLEYFEIAPKPGVVNPTTYEQMTAVQTTNGPCALFEFTGALPRAKLYSNWQVLTNDQSSLDRLKDPAFAPDKTVVVDSPLPVVPGEIIKAGTGTVEITSYAPKQVRLHVAASAPSVLLLNQHFDPNWKVVVDGKSQTLLRCNYVMQGVQVPAGAHEIEFRFAPPQSGLYLSLASIALGLALAGFLGLSASRNQDKDSSLDQGELKKPMANQARS